MKRIVSLLTLLTYLFLFCASALADDAPGLVGAWIGTDGYGTLTLRLDGSATMVYYDDTMMDTTWGPTNDGYRFGDGMWYNSPMVLLDDTTLSVSVTISDGKEPYAAPWRMENGSATVDGLALVFREDGRLVMKEDGAAE